MTVRRILIVDDEEHIRAVAQATLELVGGWEVLTADSGGGALVAAAAARLDAILLDVMMPGMDGLTALRHMRATPPSARSRSCCSPPRSRPPTAPTSPVSGWQAPSPSRSTR